MRSPRAANSPGCSGYGVGIADDHVLACARRCVSVLQFTLKEGRALFEHRSFGMVLQLQTLLHLRNTEKMLRETARVGRIGILGFPNLAHWPNRLAVLRGRMPVTRTLPCDWYDTPKNPCRRRARPGSAPLAQPARQRGGVQVRAQLNGRGKAPLAPRGPRRPGIRVLQLRRRASNGYKAALDHPLQETAHDRLRHPRHQ